MDKVHLSNEVDNKGESAAARVDEDKPLKKKRDRKMCSKCGKSVINVSRHQKEVHGMNKIKRKLNDYLTGEKKKPRGTVKFCPLSPCKRSKTPIFQLDKHLKSSTHGLKPNTPAYIRALDKARRVSLHHLKEAVKNEKERKKVETKQNKRKRKESMNDSDNERQDRVDERGVKESGNSDQEYDDLSNRVWERIQNTRGKLIARDLDETSSSEAGSEEEELQFRTATCTKTSAVDHQTGLPPLSLPQTPLANTDDEVVILTESDNEPDSDYIPNEDSSKDDSSEESTPSQDTNLSEEKQELFIGLVETIGRKNIESGSFLDVEGESAWKNAVQSFVRQREYEGHTFKTEQETLEDLAKLQSEDSHDIDEELLQDLLNDDRSEDDDALDEEWEPSDCEQEATETDKEHPDGEFDVATNAIITEFYDYLVDVDGGYRNTKIAQQYKAQVKSVIRTCKTQSTEQKEHQEMPAYCLLLIPGRAGVKLLKSWLTYAVNKYQPGTVRSYLMSLRLFFKFLIQEEKSVPGVTLEVINARRDLMTSWSSAQKKSVLKRKLEKYDEDYRKLLSSENLHQVCHGNQHVNAVKQLASSLLETNQGDDTAKIISDKSHCEVRDWLITRVLIDNSGRSGNMANMTTSEFNEAVFYEGTDEDPARYRVLIKDHKTAGVYGSAVVWFYDDLYLLTGMYVRTVRSQFLTADSNVDNVFISSNGLALTSSQVSTSVFRTFQREGIEVKGKICATTIRKSLATGVHVNMPDQQDHLAALAQHKPQTQAKYYRVHDKVNETDLGRRAVKNLVAMKNRQINPAKKENSTTPAPWTAEETKELTEIFQAELDTGAIQEQGVAKKLNETSLLSTHSTKAVVLKLRRMRQESMENVEPPTEQITNKEKVLKFLDDCQTNAPSTSKAASVFSESSRFWSKFSDEQTRHLTKLTADLVTNNVVKKENVWERVTSDPRAVELGLITGSENEEEVEKVKQRLVDKVRAVARKRKASKKK